jgi:hypothetical protein
MSTKMWTRRLIAGIGLVLTAVIAPGCGDAVRSSRSPAYLVITELSAEAGGFEEEASNELNSDVQTDGGVFEDVGVVTLRLALKDIGQPGSGVGPSANNVITVTRHRVNFRRTDGRNTPGVDVPWPFEGAGTVSVSTDETEMSFVIVRAQAKLESPLRQLANASFGGLGGAGLISTIADVTFYGHDQVGNEVTVTGSISVNFADWADPDN